MSPSMTLEGMEPISVSSVSKLNVLIGQKLEAVELVHDYHQMHFASHVLNVFNPMVVEERGPSGDGREVASVRDMPEEIQITLSDGTTITIDMRPPRWTGPEALALYRGDERIVVWTE